MQITTSVITTIKTVEVEVKCGQIHVMCKPVQNKQNNHILRFEICYTFNMCTLRKKNMIGCTLHESVTMS